MSDRNNVCPQCGNPIEAGARFCGICGTSIDIDVQSNVPPREVRKEKKLYKDNDLKSKPQRTKMILAIIISVVVVVAAVALLYFDPFGWNVMGKLFGNASAKSHEKDEVAGVFLLQEGNIYFTDLSNKDNVQITERLFEDEDDESFAEIFGTDSDQYTGAPYFPIVVSDDGKRVLYPDRQDSDDYSINLYYRIIDQENEDPVKIDSEIRMNYKVNDAFNKIVYLKGSNEPTLYRSDFTNKEKLDTDVDTFFINKDASQIVYNKAAGGVYTIDKKGNKEKIDTDGYLEYVSEDLSTIFFRKRTDNDLNNLYMKKSGKEKIKIADNVSSVYAASDGGTLYYTAFESGKVSLLDMVEDDMKEQDAQMTEPQEPESPNYYSGDYDSYEAYEAAYDKYQEQLDEYYERRSDYSDKEYRDEMRESLADYTVDAGERTLFYYDGAESVKVTDLVGSIVAQSGSAPAVVYSKMSVSRDKKLKLSEVEGGVSEIEGWFYDSSSETNERFIAIAAEETQIGENNTGGFVFNESGNSLLYLDEISDRKGDLYRIDIKGGKLSEPEMYESDVYPSYHFVNDNGDVVYYVDVSDNKGDLYINKEPVDYEAALNSVLSPLSDSSKYYYYTDYSFADMEGTLNVYNSKTGKKEKIADDVHSFAEKGAKVIVLQDYSSTKSLGDAVVYSGGKAQDNTTIDVVELLTDRNLRFRGGVYSDYYYDDGDDYDDDDYDDGED
ncbi:MAG: zinc ribbon domain-containing protein [Clostridiales Family XIII bacterium]|jgi:hypothetical protein|nr:zinc ribbon domain-containing protein [Clostridiales Family XIII bacterium]